MLAAAEELEFEGAAELRDQADAVRELIQRAKASGALSASDGVDGVLVLRRSEVEAMLSGKGRRQKKAGAPGVKPVKRRKRTRKAAG